MQGINLTGLQNLNSETKIPRKNENGFLLIYDAQRYSKSNFEMHGNVKIGE